MHNDSYPMTPDGFDELCRDLEPPPGSDPRGPFGTIAPAE